MSVIENGRRDDAILNEIRKMLVEMERNDIRITMKQMDHYIDLNNIDIFSEDNIILKLPKKKARIITMVNT